MLLLALAAYGLFRTNPPNNSLLGVPGGSFSSDLSSENHGNGAAALVDQTPLLVAQRLVPLATGDDERPLAQEALRLSDQEVDFAFASALRNAKSHPPVLTPEAQELQQTLADAESAVENDKTLVDRLTATEAKAAGSQKIAAGDELEIAKAQLGLDNDEVEDAKQDLIRAGGDPQGRIQAMVAEHESAVKDTPAPPSGPDSSLQAGGLVHRVYQWYSLREKHQKLAQAEQSALSAATALTAKHDNLVAQMSAKKSGTTVVTEKSSSKTGSQPEQSADETPNSPTARPRVSVSTEPSARTHEQAAVVVKVTKERSAQQNELANYGQGDPNLQQLLTHLWPAGSPLSQRTAAVPCNWRLGLHHLRLGITIVGHFHRCWYRYLLATIAHDHRPVERCAQSCALRCSCFGLLLTARDFWSSEPLGAILGLAGAGLTIAMQDFIVGFFGRFVLMGRNGIRIGDWVEINGVSGEVVELGMFHTVLLETGNWTDSGHPTGRRVTFTNSFAVQGHYFNFSTSGQWLWDELQIVLPAGKVLIR